MTTSTWIDFLTNQGASCNDNLSEISFPASTKQDDTTLLMPLTGYNLLSMIGPDSETFLQGQTSCDIRKLSPQQSLLGSNCSPKGNVISIFRLMMQKPEHLFLRVSASIKEPALANLQKYIVFSKADLTDASEEYVGIAVSGENANSIIAEHFGEAPAEVGAQVVQNGQMLVRAPGTYDRFEIWTPINEAPALWTALSSQAKASSSSEWRRQEIEAGLAVLDNESVELYLPQMLNLQAVEGVSFDKGCYIGQEVVTRLQYRGKLKKLLFRAKVCGDLVPKPGMSLHTSSRKGVGKVLAAAPAGDNSYEFQAVIGRSSAVENQLHLAEQDGPQVELLELPYQIDPELFER